MLLDRRVRREVMPKARSTGGGRKQGRWEGTGELGWLTFPETDRLFVPRHFFLLITEDDMRRCRCLRIKSPPSPEVQGASWVMMGSKQREPSFQTNKIHPFSAALKEEDTRTVLPKYRKILKGNVEIRIALRICRRLMKH